MVSLAGRGNNVLDFHASSVHYCGVFESSLIFCRESSSCRRCNPDLSVESQADWPDDRLYPLPYWVSFAFEGSSLFRNLPERHRLIPV